MPDGWFQYDEDTVTWLAWALVRYDATLVMLNDRVPVMFPRTLCLGLRAADIPKRRKRKRSRRQR